MPATCSIGAPGSALASRTTASDGRSAPGAALVTRVLVAGGAGFIGSHMCEHLLARGDEVVALDSFVTGHVSNVASLAGHPRFALVEHDIRRPEIPVDGPIDLVMHLASPASPSDFLRLSIEIME